MVPIEASEAKIAIVLILDCMSLPSQLGMDRSPKVASTQTPDIFSSHVCDAIAPGPRREMAPPLGVLKNVDNWAFGEAENPGVKAAPSYSENQ